MDMYPLVNVYIANWNITMLLMGKSTISMAIFNSYVTNYQRVIMQISSCMIWHMEIHINTSNHAAGFRLKIDET